MRHRARWIALPSLFLAALGCGGTLERSARAAEAEAAEAKRDLGNLEGKLAKTVSSNFVDVPISRILGHLQGATGVSFVLDPAVKDGTLEIRMENLSARDALDLLADMTGLDYEVRKGVVWVSTPARIAERHVVMHRYDVRELILAPKDFVGPTLSIGGAGGTANPGIAFDNTAAVDEDRSITGETLVEYIKEYIARTSWVQSCNSIQFRSGFLYVTNAPEVHQKIQAWLDEMRKTTGRMVTLDARYLSVDAATWKAILGKEGDKPAYYLDDAQARALDQALAEGANACILEQGRTTGYNAQRVTLVSVRQRAYVQDYTAVVQVSSVGVDPEIAYFMEGMALDLRPVILSDGKALHLEVLGTLAGSTGMREQKVPQGAAQASSTKESAGPGVAVSTKDVVIELPDADFQAIRTSVRVPNGKVAIFSSTSRMAGAKDKRILVLALRASVVATE
jgi:hypothetical protein